MDRSASINHIVRLGVRPNPSATHTCMRRPATSSRAFRRCDDRLVRANIARRRAANRFRRRRPLRATLVEHDARFRAPMSELTAMETGSYLNGADTLRSSPLAALQGLKAPATSSFLKRTPDEKECLIFPAPSFAPPPCVRMAARARRRRSAGGDGLGRYPHDGLSDRPAVDGTHYCTSSSSPTMRRPMRR